MRSWSEFPRRSVPSIPSNHSRPCIQAYTDRKNERNSRFDSSVLDFSVRVLHELEDHLRHLRLCSLIHSETRMGGFRDQIRQSHESGEPTRRRREGRGGRERRKGGEGKEEEMSFVPVEVVLVSLQLPC